MKHKSFDWSKIVLVILIVLLSVVTALINPRFASLDNLVSILKQIAAPGILAVGMTLVILTGGIDLSAGYGVTFGAIVMGLVYNGTGNPWLSMVGAVAACMVLGLVNGLLITRLNILPFIATLATMSITQGVLNLIALGSKFFLQHPVYTAIGSGTVLGYLPICTLMAALVMAAGAVVLGYTKLGCHVYAIGSSEKNTKLSGINTGRCKLLVYVICGLTMGIAAIVMGSRISQVTQESGGNSYLMDCIAAVIIGGTAMEGGRGDMLGTLLGVVFLGIVSSLLVFLSVPTIAQQCFKGMIILAALLVNYISKRISRREEIEAKAKRFEATA